MTNGYHTPARTLNAFTSGAWTLTVGAFEDDSYCLDFESTASVRRSREYFVAYSEAVARAARFIESISAISRCHDCQQHRCVCHQEASVLGFPDK